MGRLASWILDECRLGVILWITRVSRVVRPASIEPDNYQLSVCGNLTSAAMRSVWGSELGPQHLGEHLGFPLWVALTLV